MSTSRVITLYHPCSGEPIEDVEVASFECVVCGRVDEIDQAATLVPPDVCLECMDELSEGIDGPIPQYRREIA